MLTWIASAKAPASTETASRMPSASLPVSWVMAWASEERIASPSAAESWAAIWAEACWA